MASFFTSLFGRAEPPKPAVTQPQTAVFRPTFEKPVGYGPNGYINRYLNPDYFATAETAEEVMRRFGAKEWFERVSPGNEGPLYTASHKERWLRFADGVEVNAGLVAAYFSRGPEDLYPGWAQKMASDYIALARREWLARIAEEGGGQSGGGD